ncbi:hypothetical protein PN499_13405 [Kamptonema animale CS-326]|jgi:hypothetical protein|uniref:hypothetical protein n=1 Tax=Kamptonema animale TaxID=92934 RepID=UPI00232F4E96|nr:hypothetical protein [Kamptonema animale]MDB9512184.1 hypothetical protein [Kamptonema animale CS-326]
MQLLKLLGLILLYILGAFGYVVCTVALVSIAILIKVAALLLADRLLYPIFIVGDLFKGIEVVELLNILVFAILGMGFGVATVLLYQKLGRQTSAILLIISVPLIFISTPVVRYNIWLQTVGVEETLSPEQAEKLTNSFLNKRVGNDGFLGFYLYTAQFPILPTKQVQMNDLDNFEKKVNSKFVQLTGVPPTIVSWLMATCFWCLRIFYFSIAAIATISHFREGLRIVKR